MSDRNVIEFNGAVRFEVIGSDQAGVTIARTVRRGDANEVKTTLEQEGALCAVSVSFTPPAHLAAIRAGKLPPPQQPIVDVVVHVPIGAPLKIDDVNGTISLEHLRGAIDATSENGEVRASDVGARLHLDAENGPVQAAVTTLQSGVDIDIESADGSIRLALPSAYRGSVDASSANGAVRSSLPVGAPSAVKVRAANGAISIVQQKT